jgi:hypothetical protein
MMFTDLERKNKITMPVQPGREAHNREGLSLQSLILFITPARRIALGFQFPSTLRGGASAQMVNFSLRGRLF